MAQTKKPHFATSFSGMEQFLICPYQWGQSKYYKTIPWEETEPIKWGNRVHAMAEAYMLSKLGKPHKALNDAEALAPVQSWCDIFLKSGANFLVEQEMCCTKDLKPCGWKDWAIVWFRGKADLIIIKDRRLNVLDYKSGKKKEDTFQIEVMIALADLFFGDQFDEANGKLIFVKEADPRNAIVSLPKPVLKADIPAIWAKIFGITSRMEEAWASENFRMQSNGLCKNWCGATSCPHCGRK